LNLQIVLPRSTDARRSWLALPGRRDALSMITSRAAPGASTGQLSRWLSFDTRDASTVNDAKLMAATDVKEQPYSNGHSR